MTQFFSTKTVDHQEAAGTAASEKEILHKELREIGELLHHKDSYLKTINESTVTHYHLTNAEQQIGAVLSIRKGGITKPLALKKDIQSESPQSGLNEGDHSGQK